MGSGVTDRKDGVEEYGVEPKGHMIEDTTNVTGLDMPTEHGRTGHISGISSSSGQ